MVNGYVVLMTPSDVNNPGLKAFFFGNTSTVYDQAVAYRNANATGGSVLPAKLSGTIVEFTEPLTLSVS